MLILFSLILVFIVTLPFTLWLFGVRPYCLRHGKGYTPGANLNVTMWIDWQQATEVARAEGDRRMLVFLRLCLVVNLTFVLFWFLALVSGLLN